MSAKQLLTTATGLLALVLIGIGLLQLTSGSGATSGDLAPLSLAQMQRRLAGSPPQLNALHTQAGQLVGGGAPALHARLTSLRGTPIVINKWASWCEPCRSEFAAFEHAGSSLGRQVAFIGIDSGDTSRAEGLAFLRSYPVPYPSYYDPSGALGSAITDSSFMPVTVFYDTRGGIYIHQGAYPSLAKLEADIRRYALRGEA